MIGMAGYDLPFTTVRPKKCSSLIPRSSDTQLNTSCPVDLIFTEQIEKLDNVMNRMSTTTWIYSSIVILWGGQEIFDTWCLNPWSFNSNPWLIHRKTSRQPEHRIKNKKIIVRHPPPQWCPAVLCWEAEHRQFSPALQRETWCLGSVCNKCLLSQTPSICLFVSFTICLFSSPTLCLFFSFSSWPGARRFSFSV